MVRALIPCVLVACGGGGVEGRLVDVMHDNAPIAGEKLVAKAIEQVRMTCQQLSATTDESGHFKFDSLCLNETAYRITPTNDNLLALGGASVASPGTLVLEGWWAPKGDGTYLLHPDGLQPLKTHADLRHRQLDDSEASVSYPASLPDDAPRLGAGDYLVLTGEGALGTTRIAPLVHSESRTFGEVTVEPWWYIGVEFTSDTEVREVAVVPRPERVRDIGEGDRKARFIAGDAVPAGRYAVYRDGGRRVSVIHFGEATEGG